MIIQMMWNPREIERIEPASISIMSCKSWEIAEIDRLREIFQLEWRPPFQLHAMLYK